MAFKPVRYDRGKVVRLPVLASQTITKHGAIIMNSGYADDAGSGANIIEYVALETVTEATGSNGGAYVDAIPVDDNVIFDADLDATGTQALVGTYIDIASHTTLDTDASTDDIFYVEKLLSSTKVRGHFCKFVPQS